MLNDYGGAFHEIEESTGKTYNIAESRTYSIAEIVDYLSDCMKDPQNDTKVTFEIEGNGKLHIITANDETAGEIDATDFKEVKNE